MPISCTETGLPSLINTIERTFLENDINLPMCLLKSICTLTHQAGESVRTGQASDMELILDGVASWSWLLSWLEQSALRQAIEAGRIANSHYCQHKYPQCKWTAPEQQLLELLHSNVRFKWVAECLRVASSDSSEGCITCPKNPFCNWNWNLLYGILKRILNLFNQYY